MPARTRFAPGLAAAVPALLAMLLPAAPAAHAQSAAQAPWPQRPVRIVVAMTAGGTGDLLARTLAESFSRAFGQPFVLEHRPGANGNVGADLVAKSSDGHTLLLSQAGPLSINPNVMTAMPFEPRTAFAPVSRLATIPLVLVVNPAVPAQNVRALVDWIRGRAGDVSYASQGNASSGHLAMELLRSMASFEITHVPYKGSAGPTADVVAGHVPVTFNNTTTVLPFIRRGQLRALGVAELKRVSVLPDVPTLDEAGFPGFEASPWMGLSARSGTAPEIVERLADVARQTLSRTEVRERYAALGVELFGSTPAEFAAYIENERAKWATIARRASLTID